MSKLKVSGNASGTGVITLEAPNTNTDRAITLPDSAGALVNTAPSTSGNILTSDGTNWTSATPAGADFSDGGDTAGADRTIGNNDNYALSFETNATERLNLTNDGRGVSQFTARMWCNLNGTGTIAIRDSHNVSSISDGGTGFFTVYIDNDMANSNHVHFVTAQQDSSGNFGGDIDYFGGLRRTPRATGGVDLSCQQGMTNPVDPQYLMVVVFGE